MTAIDWSSFDKHPENTNLCGCGARYRSHSKFLMSPQPRIVTRKPCPACGEADGNVIRSSSDPEVMTI